MTIIANTRTTFAEVGRRESLSDVIYNISPMDTPVTSSMPRPKCTQTLEEWQTDALAAVDTANAHIEGDDITSFPANVQTARVGNYTQISRKLVLISDTDEVVDKAGRTSQEAYELGKKGNELKRDKEAMVLENNAGVAGNDSTAREIASLGAWLKTNVDKHATGTNPTYTSGVPNAARGDGTQRAFTETILKNAQQLAWTSGGKPNVLYVGPVNKAKVSAFSGIATRNYDLSNVDPRPTAVIASVDVYVGDFGTLRVIPNRFQRERDAWLIDHDFLTMPVLRPMKRVVLAKTGDARKRMIVEEWTLQVKQEAALALCADLTTT